MKIMDKKVMHKRFGMGSVIGLKDNKMYPSEKYSGIRHCLTRRFLPAI